MQSVDTLKNTGWLARRYGSRRGFLSTTWYRLQYYLGRYRSYQRVDWKSVGRVVFICKGNICRSAYAEAVARTLGVDAVSCGLDTIENSFANKDAMRTAKNHGVDLAAHRTQPIMYLVLRKTDLLIAMEPWQLSFLKKHISRKYQYTLLGLRAKPVLPHIQDPYGACSEYFDSCFLFVRKNVISIVEKINT